MVPELGFSFASVWISGLARRRFWVNVLVPLKMAVSLIQSLNLIRRFRPDAVLGTGGYASWPVLAAARLASVPLFVQEQNIAPGLVTRMFAKHAAAVFLSFEESKRFFKKGRFVVSGNPTRPDLDVGNREEAINRFGLDPKRPTLLVFGGSQGAQGINMGILAALDRFMKETDLQILWATGPAFHRSIQAATDDWKGRLRIFPYIGDMGLAYRAANLAVCRSGATTIAELARMRLPAVFVPFPKAAAGHQEANARMLSDAGASELVLQHEIPSGRLVQMILDLIRNNERLGRIKAALAEFARPEAAATIAETILNIEKRHEP